MFSAIIAFAGSMLVAVLLTPLVRRFAIEIGAVDEPDERRVHAGSIPRMGGIALAAGFFASLLAIFVLKSEVARAFFAEPMHMIGLSLGGLLLCGLGVLDDIRGIRAWHKLWVQVVAAVIAYVCGYRIDAVALPFFGSLDMGVFGVAVTSLWIVAIVNAINLIDGLDGLAGGVAFLACVTNFVVGAINGDAIVMLLSASLGGAVLGFLLFNFNPASIFMGDSGSMFLGFVLATTSILGNSVKSSTTVAILVPFVALGLPIMDTLLVMLRRFLAKRPIFAADRQHIHHRLLEMGLTHKRAVLALYGLSVFFTAGAITVSLGRNWQVGAALVVLSLAVVGVVRAMGNFEVALRGFQRKAHVRPGSVDRFRSAVPLALQRITAARELSEIPEILSAFAEAASVEIVELEVQAGAAVEPFHFRANPASRSDGEFVTISYELAAVSPGAKLHFSWPSTLGDVVPESDILLQLVADACEARIARAPEERRAITGTGTGTGRHHLRPV